jgi:hypothetical protein
MALYYFLNDTSHGLDTAIPIPLRQFNWQTLSVGNPRSLLPGGGTGVTPNPSLLLMSEVEDEG